jgi:ABC-2 type transport system permease protein
MKGVFQAFITEGIKVLRSKMLPLTIIAFIFMALMLGLLTLISKYPDLFKDAGLMTAKASIIGKADWPSFFGLLIQTAAMVGSMGCGFVASWVFGREYTDRTQKDLLALPVSRNTIVIGKFTIIALWCALLSLVLLTTAMITGMIIGLEAWSPDSTFRAALIFSVTWLLDITLCAPLAFFACVSRGILLPIAFLIVTMIVSQTLGAGLPAIAAYFPWAVPPLYSMAALAGHSTDTISFAVVALTGVAGIGATLAWWRFADHT